MKNLFAVIVSFFLFACSSTIPQTSCEQTRAAIDVGSGSTRVLVALVNHCEGRIKEVLFDDEQAVPYRDSMVEGQNLSPGMMAQGKALLATYVAKSKELKATKIAAVGTEVFRRALNGASFVEEVNRDLGLNMVIIDQQFEARLGYSSVLSQADISENVVVWDVGGASTQITAKVNGQFQYYLPKYGSVVFKKYVIQDLQKKNPEDVNSPNPVHPLISQKAEASVLKSLNQEGYPEWLTTLLSNPGTRVYGIGGVHMYSIQGQIKNGRNNYTEKEVAETLKKQLKKTDKQIGGEYAATEVTNLVMVKAFLKALNMKVVHPIKVSLAQGLLFN